MGAFKLILEDPGKVKLLRHNDQKALPPVTSDGLKVTLLSRFAREAME